MLKCVFQQKTVFPVKLLVRVLVPSIGAVLRTATPKIVLGLLISISNQVQIRELQP